MMGQTSIILFMFMCICCRIDVVAQDPHFSQYFASPMTLNPSLTGNIDGALRIAANYRQQWRGTGGPFNTATLSYEQRLLNNIVGDNDRFGLGAMIMTDNSMQAGFKNTYVSLSTSFHKGLGEQHRLGAGFQATYGNTVIDYSRLSFLNQFSGDGFNLNLPSGESFVTGLKPTWSYHTGLLYGFENEFVKIYSGWSMYHVNKPNRSILGDSSNIIPARHTIHAGIVLLNGEVLRISAHPLWQQQARATELSLGGALGYDLGSEVTLYAGGWFRFNESINPYISYVKNGVQIGLTYDWQVSNMKAYVQRNGSMELSFIYNMPDRSFERKAMPWNY
jgi:type IX secretion system PorP/SprF family membrane protein